MERLEGERRQLARELHDELGQSLTALDLNLRLLGQPMVEARRAAVLEQSAGIVERLLGRVRSLSLDLRPSMLDDLGLVPAIDSYLEQQAARAGFTAELKQTGCDARFGAEVETACFRIVQEAVNNAVKHARARHLAVELVRVDDAVHVTVADDGVGFDPRAARTVAARGRSLGLLGMEERAHLLGGRLEVDATPGGGTQVRAWLPVAPAHRPPAPAAPDALPVVKRE